MPDMRNGVQPGTGKGLAGRGRGRGVRAMDQENAKPLGAVAGAGGLGREGLDLLKKEVFAIQDEQLVQKCAEKLAVEAEGSTSPLPERLVSLGICGHFLVAECLWK